MFKKELTNRGFSLIEFEDTYKDKCSIQKSSYGSEPRIWFGIDDANPQICIQGQGFVPYKLPEEVHLTTRMHLNQEQVKQLLPILEHFAKTGNLDWDIGENYER